MNHAVTGGTGEGKSCFAVRELIIPELLHGRRPIVTNIELNIEPIREFVEARGVPFVRRQLILLPSIDDAKDIGVRELFVDVHDREGNVTQVPYNPREFWKCAPHDAILIMDETADYLNAYDLRGDEQTKVLAAYVRKHRHSGHTLYFLCQELSQLSKQLRDLVQEHITVYSFYQHPLFGLFRLSVFLIRHYDIGGIRNAPARVVRWVPYSSKYFQLYNSTQHRDSNNVLEVDTTITEEEKPVRKRSKVGAVVDFITSRPLFAIIALAAVVVGFGVARIAALGRPAFENHEITPLHQSSPDNAPDVLPDVARRLSGNHPAKQRKSSPRTSNRFQSSPVRGYDP